MSEWIEVNIPFGGVYDTRNSDELDSMKKRNLISAGVQVEMEDGERYLIGDINECRGVCDDCTAFRSDAIVRRYRVVWDDEGSAK